MTKVAIIGFGYVGQAYKKLFPDAKIYDPKRGYRNKTAVNKCDLAIICVPTPKNHDGSCNTSIVEEIVSWLKTPLILIKSTVSPGTTTELKKRYKKRICFSPEYLGESSYYVPTWKYPDPKEVIHHDFMIIGGSPEDREEVINIFLPILGPDKVYYQVDEKTSELIKYMSNAWIASKVIFCNEFYEIAKKFNIDYNQLREGFLLDSRVERMHTAVFKDKRGFDGKCLPKDLKAIVDFSKKAGYEPKLIQQVIKSNQEFLKKNKKN